VAKNTALVQQGATIKLFKSYKEGFADGQQLRDFVYVKDCVSVMLWLMANRDVSGLFNLGTGKARSFVDLVEAIGTALNKPVDIEFVEMPESIRPNYQYFTEAGMAKLREAGYSAPFHALEAGVADYVQSHLIHRDPYH
jgi:ADP-L-glycero-D-manno-heptose 6-epimerase